MMQRITYREGYKYQLVADYRQQIWIVPAMRVQTSFLELGHDGMLTIRTGYAWDGASGPAIDTRNFMRGSLVHDALYQLMREGHIGQHHRNAADRMLQRICSEDGMSALRAWWVYQGVAWAGGPSASPDHDNPVLSAP